ncbi:hypothetical protein KI387_004107, partial [Taxus chinensis]
SARGTESSLSLRRTPKIPYRLHVELETIHSRLFPIAKNQRFAMDCTQIPLYWPEPDWDNIFTDVEIHESRDEEIQIIPAPPHLSNRDASDTAAAKKRKRIQSIVFSERARRKQMRQFLSTLTSVVPIPNTKVARYCLIEETIKYIEKLHQQVQDLKKKREQLLGMKKNRLQELSSPWPWPCRDHNVNVDVEVFGDEVIIRITSLKMPRNLWKIYQVIEAQHFMDIQSADIYSGDCFVFLSFRAT